MILIDTCASCKHLCEVNSDELTCTTITSEFAWSHRYILKNIIENETAVIIDDIHKFGCIFYERKE